MDIMIEAFVNINFLKYNKNNTHIIIKLIYSSFHSEFLSMNTMSLYHQFIT